MHFKRGLNHFLSENTTCVINAPDLILVFNIENIDVHFIYIDFETSIHYRYYGMELKIAPCLYKKLTVRLTNLLETWKLNQMV